MINKSKIVSFLILFLIGLKVFLWIPKNLAQEVSPLSPTVEQIRQYYGSGQYKELIDLLESALLSESGAINPTAYRYLGAAYTQIGEFGKAIHSWEKAIEIYRSHPEPDSRRLEAALLIDQAQAYINWGRARKAIPLLSEAIEISSSEQIPQYTATATAVMGNAHLLEGDFGQAIDAYSNSLELAQAINKSKLASTALNNLTNAHNRLAQKYLLQRQWALQEKEVKEAQQLFLLAQQAQATAQQYAQQALSASSSLENASTARALLNLIPFVETQQQATYKQQALSILEKLSPSRTKVYLLINLASLTQAEPSTQTKILEKAIQAAESISDYRGLSHALGQLGNIYEKTGDYGQALTYTQQAQLAAKQIFAFDSLYQWQWQAARIWSATGSTERAGANYQAAIASWQQIRNDLAAASQDFQFDFRAQVEPLYREYLALLLSEDSPDILREALHLLELFQLAELENFFGDPCVEGETIEPEEVLAKTNAALIHSVILPEQTYLILQLPDGSIRRYQVALTADQLTQKLQQWRDLLEEQATYQYLSLSQKLYDWLIRPMEADLEQANPDALIFVNDGLLRNVPIAALHDGEQYLIEKYPIAASIGLKFSSFPKPIEKSEVDASTFGLSAAIPPLDALPNVEQEVLQIHQILGGQKFLNEQFTKETLQQQVEKSQQVIHLATHSRFGGNPNRAFLQAFDRRISLPELEDLLRSSSEAIDLITFSACQTAAGNDRSLLGLAGIAVRSGVNSTVGTLWPVNDEAVVELMADFYQYLKQPGVTKAEALRQAQLNQIRDIEKHPSTWASIILIGNWL
ncbi:MAG: CHAT domain-containing protein [Xenococcaceae cyanobacterium]